MPDPLHRIVSNQVAKPDPINPKVAAAIKAVIHDGETLQAAAEANGITTHKLRSAFDKPHVLKFVRAERNVRLEGIRLSSLNELERIRRGEGMAAIAAIKFMEEMAGERGKALDPDKRDATPGVTIVIQSAASHTIEEQHVTPLTIEGETAADSPESAHAEPGREN